VLETETVWDWLDLEPNCALRLKDAGIADSWPELETFIATGIFTGLPFAEGAVIEIEPAYLPGDRLEG
jgi:hypothetical protein